MRFIERFFELVDRLPPFNYTKIVSHLLFVFSIEDDFYAMNVSIESFNPRSMWNQEIIVMNSGGILENGPLILWISGFNWINVNGEE